MESSVKTKLLCLMTALLVGASSAEAPAQGVYPSSPVKIVVGFPPGVVNDTIARVIAPKLGSALGQSFVIENKPGAASSIGAAAVARSPADGYTLYLSGISDTVYPSMNKVSFDFAADLAPISLAGETPALLVVLPSGPATFGELVTAAKAKPDEFKYGTGGVGSAVHLYAELVGLATAAKFTHVPYKGSSQALVDLLAGRIEMMFTPSPTVLEHVKSGALRALGVIGRQRMSELPDVPTFTELGIAGTESAFWFGLSAPAATPKPIIERLNKEIVNAVAVPDVVTQLKAAGIDPVSSSVESFGAFIRRDLDKWAQVVKAAGVKAN